MVHFVSGERHLMSPIEVEVISSHFNGRVSGVMDLWVPDAISSNGESSFGAFHIGSLATVLAFDRDGLSLVHGMGLRVQGSTGKYVNEAGVARDHSDLMAEVLSSKLGPCPPQPVQDLPQEAFVPAPGFEAPQAPAPGSYVIVGGIRPTRPGER